MDLLARVIMTSLLLASQRLVDSGPTPAHYDQRQDGKYNIKIHLKDIKLISLGTLSTDSLNGEYDDSNYDYEDPPDPAETSTTTKPPSTGNNATTNKPTKLANTSLTNNSTTTGKPTKLPNTSLTNNSTTTGKPIKLANTSLTNNSTTTNKPTKLANASLPNNSTIKDVKLDTDSPTHAALTSLVNAPQTSSVDTPDCPDNNGTTSGPEEIPSSSIRPARVQPTHITRHRTTSTPRPTPYHPYSIISTTRRSPVKQGTMRKMRCRPGFSRDRAGRCRKVREQEKKETS